MDAYGYHFDSIQPIQNMPKTKHSYNNSFMTSTTIRKKGQDRQKVIVCKKKSEAHKVLKSYFISACKLREIMPYALLLQPV